MDPEAIIAEIVGRAGRKPTSIANRDGDRAAPRFERAIFAMADRTGTSW